MIFNLAHGLASKKINTLCVDNDTQGNLTEAFLPTAPDGSRTSSFYSDKIVHPIKINDYLHLYTGGTDLRRFAGLETGVGKFVAGLKGIDTKNQLVTLIDCGASMTSNLNQAAIAASHYCLVPVHDDFSLSGIKTLYNDIRKMNDEGISNIRTLGFVPMRIPNTTLHRGVMLYIRKNFKNFLFETTIPNLVAFAQSTAQNIPAIYLNKSNPAWLVINNFTKEFINRLREKEDRATE